MNKRYFAKPLKVFLNLIYKELLQLKMLGFLLKDYHQILFIYIYQLIILFLKSSVYTSPLPKDK